MKIALVGRYGDGEILSGPEKVARNLFNQISLLNPNSIFLTYFFKSGKRRKVKQLLFGCEIVPENQKVKKLGIINLVSTIIGYKPDIVHLITFERFEIIVLFLKLFLRFKIVYTTHGIYKYERELFYNKQSLLSKTKDLLLEKLIFTQTDKIVFLSNEMFNLAQNYYKIENSKVTIIPNGVEVPKVLREINFNISNGIEIVFYNGLDASRERGLNKLTKIITKIDKNRIHLSILGYPIKTEFESVTFYDPMNEELLFDFLLTKQVFVDNLDYMPFSILALESMALGLVPIVSDKSGLAYFINNGKNGFVYNSKNPDEIGDILNDILIQKFDLELISANAKTIYKQLNWENISKQYYKAYRSIV